MSRTSREYVVHPRMSQSDEVQAPSPFANTPTFYRQRVRTQVEVRPNGNLGLVNCEFSARRQYSLEAVHPDRWGRTPRPRFNDLKERVDDFFIDAVDKRKT
jgi:hypothetical protein